MSRASILSADDCGAVPSPRRGEALYPKLRPGPRGATEEENVACNQRARLYGAMIELVAVRGYERSTVAELCGLAGVSKRTLYERFPGGKQQCFLATYDIIVYRAQKRILAAAQRAQDACANGRAPASSGEPLRVLVEAFAREVAAHPDAARLVVVEVRDAGPAALAHAERTRRLIERVIASSLCEGSDASAPSPQMVRAILKAGVRVVCARLCDGRVAELAGELAEVCLPAAASPSRRLAGTGGDNPPAFAA